MLLFHCRDCMLKKCGSLVQMKLRFPLRAIERFCRIFGLQRSAKALRPYECGLPSRGFELSERGDSQLAVKLQDLVGAKARNGEELKDAFGYFLTELLRLGCDPVW